MAICADHHVSSCTYYFWQIESIPSIIDHGIKWILNHDRIVCTRLFWWEFYFLRLSGCMATNYAFIQFHWPIIHLHNLNKYNGIKQIHIIKLSIRKECTNYSKNSSDIYEWHIRRKQGDTMDKHRNSVKWQFWIKRKKCIRNFHLQKYWQFIHISGK